MLSLFFLRRARRPAAATWTRAVAGAAVASLPQAGGQEPAAPWARAPSLLNPQSSSLARPFPSTRPRSAMERLLLARPLSSSSTARPRPAMDRLLVANRGEIACRVLQTAKRLGIPTVAVYSDADAGGPHVKLADAAFRLGTAPAALSYLNVPALLAAAAASGATAVHPGYGFLSENADFAAAVEGARLAWVGPPSSAIAALGDKVAAKELMAAAGVPVVPGYHGADQSDAALTAAAEEVGYPVLVKAVAGGGGKGMKAAARPADLPAALASARREAAASFGNDRLLVERLVLDPRHIEVQVLADAHGGVVYLNERDCSVQRRHQKVLEEAPAPGLAPEMRKSLGEAAVAAARAVGYVGAGTVEFLVDGATGDAFFLEVNARLQVEHPVTEGVTTVRRGGVGPPAPLDLVEEQLRAAAGERLGFTQADVGLEGHAIEARLYAERPEAGFLPSAGTVSAWRRPPGAASFEWGGEGG